MNTPRPWGRLAVCLFGFLSAALPAPGITFTNDTLISFDNTNYDGAPIIITNCTVTVDGAHSFASLQVLSNGLLTHSAGTNGFLSNILSVTNEQQTLIGTNAVPLNNSNVITLTVVVHDLAGLIIYANNADYILTLDSNGFTTGIQRTDASSIPDGGVVAVNYQALLGQIPTGLNLAVTSDVTVASGGAINVIERGYAGGSGAGAGASASGSGGGGGYGGYGGMSLSNSPGGKAYGSTLHPTDKGSGGGTGYAGPGGSGGGAALLTLGGSLRIDGNLSANGANGTNGRSGGGAGGSISVSAQTISGSGTISADGGNGEQPQGGGGGGGRIALYYQSSIFSGTTSARGGAGGNAGGAGTVFTKAANQPGSLVADNGGVFSTNTLVDTTSETTGPYSVWAKGGAAVSISVSSIQALSSLLVSSNGWILPGSTPLTVSGDATIQAGGGVIADGLGFQGGVGPGAGRTLSTGFYTGGGAGFGGIGGTSVPGAAGGLGYGSIAQPTNPGSGGGNIGGTTLYLLGGSGGGSIQLNVSGTFTVNGRISADGRSGLSQGTGGGSGGSLWLTVGTLAGGGLVSASGGLGNGYGGGGGGGRIAIYYAANTFSGTTRAWGAGNGATFGGPGTIYTRASGQSAGHVLVDNGGPVGFSSALNVTEPFALAVQGGAKIPVSSSFVLGSLLVSSNSLLVVSNAAAALTVTGNANVQPGAGIIADNTGYPAGQGPGAGRSAEIAPYPYTVIGGGGGYGGFGGSGGVGGAAYGSAISPNSMGSGGATANTNTGGPGGGVIHLSVTGTLTVDGKISADGGSGAGQNSGGGSGGSVWLSAGTLRGAGTISAKGGNGPALGGGGGGGRISIQPTTNLFSGTMAAYGGNGSIRGGAGTIYTIVPQQIGLMLADNGGQTGTNTLIIDGGTFDITVQRGARLADPVPTIRNLVLSSNAWLIISNRMITVTANAVIPAGCGISADSTGSPGGVGIGRGAPGGGSYGGLGGGNSLGAGPTYGSMTFPVNPGSGGYNGSIPTLNVGSGGPGGGAIGLSVTGILSVDGTISANGGNGGASSGGGSGGTIQINAGTILGGGTISANGGAGNGAGGGGGGRIAIYYTTSLFSGPISALGGGGTAFGGAGTIYIKANTQPVAQIILDNGGQPGTNTSLGTASGTGDIVLRGGAVLSIVSAFAPLTGIRNMTISSNSWVLFSNVVQTVSLSGNVTIQSGGGMLADGRGYGGAQGTGAGATTVSSYGTTGGGGGHGGAGGSSRAGAAGGRAYDVTDAAIMPGSGGGNGAGSFPANMGGSGGGLILLTIAGALQNDGRISANGAAGAGEGSGGGAGGGISLTVGALAGAGNISANGGAGNGLGGGGGGGRITIKFSGTSFTGPMTAFGGAGGTWGGAGTIYTKMLPQGTPKVLVDNGGGIGTNTLVSVSQPFDLTVQNGATVYPANGYFTLNSLVIGTNAMLVPLGRLSTLDVAVFGNAVIQPSGGLSADGLGYSQGLGTGAGLSTNSVGSGAGYGGAGGVSSQLPGGITYGSALQPIDFGSGGGAGFGPFIGGSEGGGAIRLSVAGTLTLNGWISASGNGGAQDDSGGGSGGSIWVTAKTFTGTGWLAADGGDGQLMDGGGGGGGRIALYSRTNTFTGQALANGGAGWFPGAAGSIFISTNIPTLSVVSQTPTGVVSNAVSTVNLVFSAPVDLASIAPNDFLLQTPNGLLDSSNYTLVTQGTASFQLGFPSQTALGTYTVLAGPQINDLFGQAMSQTYTGAFGIALPAIQGQVTNLNGQPIAGVVLDAGSGITPGITDANGNYTIGVPPGFAAHVVPSLNGTMFVPGGRYYGSLGGSISNENYLAVTTIGPTLGASQQGTNIVLNWFGLAGVQYSTFYSSNFVDWVFYGDVSPTNNGPAQLVIPIGPEPKKFFRMQAAN